MNVMIALCTWIEVWSCEAVVKRSSLSVSLCDGRRRRYQYGLVTMEAVAYPKVHVRWKHYGLVPEKEKQCVIHVSAVTSHDGIMCVYF